MPINEYDDIIERQSKPLVANEYDAIISEGAGSQTQQLRQSMTAAQQTTPDRRAKVLELSERTKLPPEIVERNFDIVSRKAAVEGNDYDRIISESPKLGAFLKNPDNAAVAQDDIANLSKLDKVLNAGARGVLSLRQVPSTLTLKANAQAYEQMFNVHRQIEQGRDPASFTLKDDPLGVAFATPEQRLRLISEAAGKIGPAVGNIVDLEIRKRAIPTDPTVVRALNADTFGEFWAEFSKKPGEFIATVGVESLPMSAPGWIGAAVMPGGLIAKAATIGAGSTVTDYAATVMSALQAEGVDLTDREAVATAVADKALMGRVGQKAFAHSTAVGALDFASGGLAGKTLIPAKAIKNVVGRQAANLALQAPAQGALGAAGEAAGTLAAGEELKAGEIAAEFFGEFVGTPAEVASVSGGALLNNVQRARTARQNAAFFTALGEGVSESKTFQRLPQKMQEFVEQATRDGPIEKIYVPVEAWQSYWQSQNADPKGIAAEVTGDAKAYDEAVETGADIAIPIGRYAARIAGTEHNAFFANELRLDPEQMNGREAAELETRLAAEVNAELERMRAAPTGQGATGADAVVANIEQQLIAAGMEPSTAATNAQLYRAMGTIAERAGLDPQELFARYGLQIQRPDLAEPTAPGVIELAQNDYLARVREAGEIPVPAEGLSVEDKRGYGELHRRGLVRVVEREGQQFLVPGRGSWFEDATPRQQAALDAIGEPQRGGFRELAYAAPSDDLHTAAASHFEDYEVMPGVREIPFSALGPLLEGYDTPGEMQRISELASRIATGGQIDPIFVGVDPNGEMYIMEGQHRARALLALGYDAVPARVVVSMEGTDADYAEVAPAAAQFQPGVQALEQAPVEGRPTQEQVRALAEEVRERNGVDILDLRLLPSGDVRLETIAAGRTGAGVGTAAMQDVIDWADANDVRLVLSLAEKGYQPIERGPKTSSPTRLRQFYKRFGFVENKGRNKDFRISEGMYREPVAKPQAAQQVSVTLNGREIPVTLNRADAAAGYSLVMVDVAAFDPAFQRERNFYVGERGAGGIEGRYERFAEFIETAPSIEASDVGVDAQGGVMFGNGRHRYAYLRDQGVTQIPVAMDSESAANARRFGYVAAQPVTELQQAERPVPPSVYNAGSIASAFKLARSKQFVTNREFKVAIQERVRAAAKAEGVDLTVDTPAVREYLTRALVTEGREALRTNANAVGWYDDKVSTALAVMSLIHPEIATDPQSHFAFIWALAVTSNGMRVDKNFELAMRAYEGWKDSGGADGGRFPLVGEGPTKGKINNALEYYSDLITEMGYEQLQAFMTTPATVREIYSKVGKKPSGESLDEVLYGASVLGPKIGNGFFMNLYGVFTQLTMDRWYVRLWTRLTGQLVNVDRETVKAYTTTVSEMIKVLLRPEYAAQRKAIESAIGRKLAAGKAKEVAAAVAAASSKEAFRDLLVDTAPLTPELNELVTALRGAPRSNQRRISFGDEFRKASLGLHKAIDGQKEAPAGPKERQMMRAVTGAALAELQAEYPELTMADLQALVWYPEKRLYETAVGESERSEDAGYEDDEAPDYANAAVKLASSRGINESVIQKAVTAARAQLAARKRAGSGRRGTGNASPVAQGQPGRTGRAAGRGRGRGLTTLLQPAYHGTPHRFDRFSLEAIGTGEGAQAFGWGLYFAENPSIAEGYRSRLAGDSEILSFKLGPKTVVRSGQVLDYSPRDNTPIANVWASLTEDLLIDDNALRAAAGTGQLQEFVHALIDRKIAEYVEDWPEGVAAAREVKKILSRKGAISMQIDESPGALYQVDIPDASVARMLDWEAPLSQQPQAVRDAIAPLVAQIAALPDRNGPTNRARDRIADYSGTGEDLYNRLMYLHGKPGAFPEINVPDQKAASKALLAVGIPGIKYLDASSRTQQTRVFDAEGNRVTVDGDSFAFANGFESLDAAITEAQRQAQTYPGMQRIVDELLDWQGKGYELREDVTRNLVVFDDAIVKITHRDGSPVTAQERQEFLQAAGMEQPARGRISFGPERQFRIDLLGRADLSTFLHETGHFYLEVMGDVVDALKAMTGPLTETQARMVSDYDAALKWLGVSSRAEIQVEHHEKWARGIEAYVRDGKAPSEALRPIFARFRAWLVAIYRSLTQLNVELDDEVRAVMDRLFATDEEIAAVEAEGQVAAMFTDAAAAGMSEQEFAAYRATVQAASDQARDRLQAKIMAQLQRERMAWWKEERETIVAEVAAEVYERPEYIALAALQRGTRPDGSALPEGLEGVKLDRKAIVDSAGEDMLKRLPRPYVYAREGGIHPDQAAELFGFDSGGALLQAIVNARPMAQVIEGETDSRMREKHGDMLLDGTIAEEATAAVNNEERAKVITAELRALTRKQREVFGFVEAGRTDVEAELARERRERAYENRWREAERKLAVAIERGAREAEIDQLRADFRAREQELQAARREAVQTLERSQIDARKAQRQGVATIRGSIPDIATITRIARGRISQMRVRDLQPGTYLIAARRAGRAALEAAGRDDYMTAVAQKQRELLNVELYRAATAARDAVNDTVDYMHSFGRAKKRQRLGKAGADYLDQIDAILDRFDFARVSIKTIERRKSLAAWVAEKTAQGIPVDLPAELVEESRRVNYKDMTIEELAGLRDSVRHIEHLVTLKNKLLKAQAKRELDAAVEELTASIAAHATKHRGRQIETHLPQDQGARLVEGWFASHRKMSSLAREFDGFKDGGAAWELIVQPLNEAADAEASMHAEATRKLKDIFQAYQGRDIAALYRKEPVRGLGMSLAKMSRLAVALNWGNEGNRQRILSGFGWTEAQAQAVLDTLDERDWKFVSQVWRFIDSYWPQIEAKQRRVTGVAPEKVEAVPVQTKFGEIQGGYFPLKYNDRASGRALANLESSFADIAKGAAYVRATTRHGFAETRAQKVELPVRLDFGVIFEHVGEVIHDLTHHEALLDVSRVLGDKRVQEAIYDTYGDITYKQFKGVLADIANGDVGAGSTFEHVINHLRQGTSIVGMGWSVSTALLQFTGLSQSMVRVGPKWIGRALSRVMRDAGSMENSARWVREKSEFMRNRGNTQMREINEIRNQVGLTTGRIGGWVDAALRNTTFDHVTKQGVVDSFFWLIAKGQQVADIPTWIGAYEKAMADSSNLYADGTVNERRVIALADQAVLDSQGGGQAKDLAGIQRGSPLLKLWTNFYSYFNVTWNLTVESSKRARFSNPVSLGRLAVDMLMLYTVPATLGFLIKEAIRPGGEEDDDELAEKLVRENLSYMLGMMVGLREASSAAMGFFGYEGPAGARFFSTISKLVKQSAQGELDAAWWRAFNDAAGIVFHYPAGQVRRTVEGFVALREGETSNPMALITGAPKE